MALRSASIEGLRRLQRLEIHVLLAVGYDDLLYTDDLWPIREINMLSTHLQYTNLSRIRVMDPDPYTVTVLPFRYP